MATGDAAPAASAAGAARCSAHCSIQNCQSPRLPSPFLDPSMDAGFQRYNCVCSNYNYGRPHPVSFATFHRHLKQASSEEEKKRIQDAKFDGLD